MYYMVMDVESVGLYGEGFAVAYVLIGAELKEFCSMCWSCNSMQAKGTFKDYRWVLDNLPPLEINCDSPRDVRDRFWDAWVYHKNRGALLFSDCCYPVETNFIRQCIEDDYDNRIKFAPYPLYDVASIMLAAKMDPLAEYNRLDNELPKHDPVKDARQSSRLLGKALEKLGFILPL